MPTHARWVVPLAFLLGSAAINPSAMRSAAATKAPPFPARPVILIEPFGAGGGVDTIARAVAAKLSELWGQMVTVENHTGAGSTAAPALVAKAAADGYTLLVNSSAQVYAAVFRRNAPYDPVKDFVPVAPLTSQGYVFVAGKAAGVTTLAALINRARQRPESLRFGSPGVGSGSHVGTVQFNLAAGIRAVHVASDAIAEAIAGTVAGKTDDLLAPVPLALREVRAGTLVPLAISSARRSPLLPDLPTVREAGVAGFDYSIWYGVWAPARTPSPILDKVARDVARVLASADLKASLIEHGNQPMTMTRRAFTRFAVMRILRASASRSEG
jgi:tripartite-type tricarboxylate transporter receptor subunit TctC